ncbi:MAG: metallophosphatase [Actinobacteria bacterium]|nr:metallophosphatase [Actinomycetota bacterium]
MHLGDFGYWVPDPATRKYLFRVEKRLGELDMRLLFVDGNHEDHDRLIAVPLDPASGLRPISDHIAHLPRGHRWSWQDKDGRSWTWLALGGAISVDRHHSKIRKSWWPAEALTEADVASATNDGVVDVLVSHDAPARVPVPTIDRKLGWPTDVMVDADSHRQLLLTACERLRPRQLWHGHYHCRYDSQLYLGTVEARPDWDGVCHVHGLDCDYSSRDANLILAAADGTPLRPPQSTT